MHDLMRYFVNVAEAGTLTAAARRVHVTQPALTFALKRLEDEVGAVLIVRSRPKVTLTEAGRAFLPHARAALAAVTDGLRAVEEVTGLRAGSVRVGAGATACTYYLPPILAEYRRLWPKVAILVREAPTRELESGLGAGELDLALVSTDDGAEGDFFCEDELVLVARSRSVDPQAPFVTFPRGAHARDVLDELFPDAVIAMEIASIAAVKANVRAGVGIALVSRRAVARDLANHQLVELPSPRTPVVRTLSLVHRGVALLPPAALALRELLLARRPGKEARGNESRSQRTSAKRAERAKSPRRKTTHES